MITVFLVLFFRRFLPSLRLRLSLHALARTSGLEMPEISEISYSRDVCVAAVREYYRFLTRMYLKESAVTEPPPGGWPAITTERLRGLGKTDEVVSLLRHLSYIRFDNNYRNDAEGASECLFADWNTDCISIGQGRLEAKDLKWTEGDFADNVPPHVVSLTQGGLDGDLFLLDTELGIIYWSVCDDNARYHPSRVQGLDDPYDYLPEGEAEWRGDSPAWAVADFFELLKDMFRKLHFIPISPRRVLDLCTDYGWDTAEKLAILQGIYREYHWPDLRRYDKRKCLRAVQAAMEERWPIKADGRGDDDDE